MSESVTDDAVNRSRPNSPLSRAPADQGSGSREQGNEGAGIGEPGSLSPSTPTSTTSTRATATVDGSIRPMEDTRPLRSVEAIRSDLEHPHTAALTALHSTTIGDGPIGRLLRDVGPLVDRLEAVEARIAAVEAAIPAILMPIEMLRHGFDCTMRLAMYDGARCVCSLRAQISERVEAELRAALAASPTPERCGEFGIELWEMRCEYVPGGRHTHYPTGAAASPTPTGPEPWKCARPGWCACEPLRPGDEHCRWFPATPEPTEETP